MNTATINTGRQGERGNVLFLILIAVALFAALSYAVTQSSRSGGGDANSEKSLVNSAQLTQYPAGIRTAIVRMIIGGVSVEELLFDSPSDFTSLSTVQEKQSVFFPTGGGATYQLAPADVISTTVQTAWIYSADYEISQIGSSVTTSADGNDIVAFLPGVSPSICKKINAQLGIAVNTDADGDGVPSAGSAILPVYATNSMTAFNPANTGIPATETSIAGDFVGQPFGCFDSNDASNTAPLVYYHVLVER